MSFAKERITLKIYVILLILIGLYIWYTSFPNWAEPGMVLGVAFFWALIVVAEQLQVPMPRGESYVSVGFALILAAVLVLGPAAAWPAGLGQITLKDIRNFPRYYYRTLFNVAQIVICTAVAAHVYTSLGGVPGTIAFPQSIFSILATCAVYFFLNVTFIIVVLYLSQENSVVNLWASNFKWALPNYLALSPLGVLIAVLFQQIGPAGVLLLLIPLLLARHTFIQYMEMRNTYLTTIKAFVKAIEAKDKYTSGHSERVAHYVVAIGRELRLPEERIEKMEYLALLHDIGKIGVEEKVLNKPGRLSEEELCHIRAHPQIGADIVGGIRFIGDNADIIRYHHEWVDGKGYPLGLKGDKIPFESRILAVADAFDAMTSDRVYRRAMPVNKAVAELRGYCQRQFDPVVVNALVQVLKKRGEYREHD